MKRHPLPGNGWLNSQELPPGPASISSVSARTRAGVIFGSVPAEMIRMNSIQAFSFGVSVSQSPLGALGAMMGPSVISQKSP